MSRSPVSVAVVQAASVGFDLPATLDKLEALVADAAGRGAQLVVLPEAFVGTYPKGADFGVRVGLRTPEGREWFQRYWDNGIAVPGPECERIGAIARRHGVELVVGVIEQGGSTLYCSVLFFAPDGSLRGKHRKLVPTAMERVIWGQGDGSTMPVLDTPLGRVGAAICWENYMPLYRSTLYGKGVELYCAPTVDDRDVWQHTVRHIAVEGRCFVLSACQYAQRSDYPDDYGCSLGDAPDTVLIRGGSCIVDPFGALLAGPVYGESTVLVAELDPQQIVRGRYDLDVSGHYARPDVFRVEVDEAPRLPEAGR